MRSSRPLRAYAEVSLGRQRSPQHDVGPHMVPYLRAANVKDGVLDLTDVKCMNFDPREQQVFALERGDVLVTEGSGSLSSVGASAVWRGEIDGRVCFQNTLLRLRPRPGNDARFLAWWSRHAFGAGLFSSIATGANIFHVSAERVRSLRAPLFSLEEQRRIADYLDVEVGRIDELIDAERETVRLLDERVDSLIGEHVAASSLVAGDSDGAAAPVGRWMTKLHRPAAGTCETITAFRDGQVTSRTARRADGYTDAWTENPSQQGVEVGDIVIHGLDGFAGAIGVAEVSGSCSPVYHVCRPTDGDADFLARLLRLLAVTGYLSLFATSTRERAVDFRNWDRFRHIPIPDVPVERQREIGDMIRSVRPLRGAADEFVELLRERRRSMISAVITGEMEVP